MLILQLEYYIVTIRKRFCMKKSLLYLLVFIALLPSCGGKKNKSSKNSQKNGTILIENNLNDEKSGKKPLFLDDSVDEFVFEEETGAFSASSLKDAKKLQLVESEKSREWEERKAEQVKHGLKTIYFDFNQYTIRPDKKAVLQHDLAVVKKLTDQGKKIVIEGHACNFAGDEKYNLHLSEDRAKAVKEYFIKNGIAANTLKTVGRGFEMCLVQTGNQEQQAPNRRVEIYIVEEAA